MEHVRLLADTQSELPPIIVHRTTMRVIDGMHRLQAAKLRGQQEIAVHFFDGDEAEAFVLAVRTNVAHGLPLSLSDRKRAAARIIASHPQWSDRLIASVTGLAAKTVAEVRRLHPAMEDAKAPARIGRDGRLRPVNSTEGRRIAGELMLKDPSLSLRQVARAAGISPETARDVRGRLSSGEDPVLPRQRRKQDGQGQEKEPRRNAPREHGSPVAATAILAARAHFTMAGRKMLMRRLLADPSLRFNETGRILLKLLDAHTMSEEDWLRIVTNIPEHCQESVVHAARACARTWLVFADRLEQKPGIRRPEPPGALNAGMNAGNTAALNAGMNNAGMNNAGMSAGNTAALNAGIRRTASP